VLLCTTVNIKEQVTVAKANKGRVEWKGYVPCELSVAQREELRGQSVMPDELLLTLDKLIDDGYSVTMTWDLYNKCFQASMTSKFAEEEHAGWTLTGRGSGSLKALRQLFYKHFVILKENWGSATNLGSDYRDD